MKGNLVTCFTHLARHTSGRLAWIAVALLIVTVMIMNRSSGYENRNPGTPEETTDLVNSPHGRINWLALNIYAEHMMQQAGKDGQTDPIVTYGLLPGRLEMPPARRLTGESVVRRGFIYDGQELVLHGTVAAGGEMLGSLDKYKIVVGDKHLTFPEWLVEAGYTADEPELWMSLRHFYNPIDGGRLTDEHRYLAAAVIGIARGFLLQPTVDARTWALTGPGQPPFAENHWAWRDGVNAMRKACRHTGDPAERDRLFTTAWRALGETMHLLADMTVPAHVRNDAHAAITPAGSLGPDPYERFANEALIRAVIRACIGQRQSAYNAVEDAVSDRVRAQIQACTTPDELFHVVASFTNHNFFSADTVSGTVTVDGVKVTVHNANGTTDLPSPRLEDCQLDSETLGLAPMTIYSRELPMGSLTHARSQRVYMARLNWAVDNGWLGLGRTQLQCRGFDPNYDVCISQARILVPLAVYANTQLIDWFMPRFEVLIDEIDREKCLLVGRVVHHPYGPYEKRMLFSLPSGAAAAHLAQLVVNGQPQDPTRCHMTVRDGVFTCDYHELDAAKIPESAELRVRLDLGGIWVQSAPYHAAPDAGYWVLRHVTDHGMAYFPPQWKQDDGDATLTARFRANAATQCSGQLDQHGTFQYKKGSTTRRGHYQVLAQGTVKWQALPKIVPTGATWRIRVDASCTQRVQASPESGTENATADRLAASQGGLAKDLAAMRTDFTFTTSKQRTHDRYLDDLTKPATADENRVTPDVGKSIQATRLIQFNLIPPGVKLTQELFGVSIQAHLPTGFVNWLYTYEFHRKAPVELLGELRQSLASSQFRGVKKDTVDYASGGQATPIGNDPKRPGAPGRTRLVTLKHVPANIVAGKMTGFQLSVANAPHAPSYAWDMGEPSFQGQPVGWTKKPEYRYSYNRSGTYKITVNVRDKKNYSTILDKRSWQITVHAASR